MKVVGEKQLLTSEDIKNLPSEGWYEVVNGEVVELAPTGFEHGEYELGIGSCLRKLLKGKGYVVGGEVGIVLRKNPLTVRAADIVYISKERLPQKPKGMLEVPPELVVEIVSESNTFQEIEGKVKDYLDFGVDRVLLVDPANGIATLYEGKSRTARMFSFSEEIEVVEGVKISIKGCLEE